MRLGSHAVEGAQIAGALLQNNRVTVDHLKVADFGAGQSHQTQVDGDDFFAHNAARAFGYQVDDFMKRPGQTVFQWQHSVGCFVAAHRVDGFLVSVRSGHAEIGMAHGEIFVGSQPTEGSARTLVLHHW